MKLCTTSNILRKRDDGTPVPFEESIRFAAGLGFQEIDLSLDTPLLTQPGWEKEIEQRVNTVAHAGLSVRYMHLPFDYPAAGDEEGWEKLSEATINGLLSMKRYGVSCAAIHPRSYMTEHYDEDDEYRKAYSFLLPFCAEAHRLGLHLCIENMRGAGRSAPQKIRRFGMDTDILLRLADELDEKVCWDTGHAFISLQNQKKSILKIGNRLCLVHINDNFGEDDIHLAPYLGRVPWDEIMGALAEIRYQGSLDMEVSCRHIPEELWPVYGRMIAASGLRLIHMFDNHAN